MADNKSKNQFQLPSGELITFLPISKERFVNRSFKTKYRPKISPNQGKFKGGIARRFNRSPDHTSSRNIPGDKTSKQTLPRRQHQSDMHLTPSPQKSIEDLSFLSQESPSVENGSTLSPLEELLSTSPLQEQEQLFPDVQSTRCNSESTLDNASNHLGDNLIEEDSEEEDELHEELCTLENSTSDQNLCNMCDKYKRDVDNLTAKIKFWKDKFNCAHNELQNWGKVHSDHKFCCKCGGGPTYGLPKCVKCINAENKNPFNQ